MKPWWLDTNTNRRQVERRTSDRRAQPRVGRDRRRRDRRARALLVSLAALASVPTATRPDLFGRRNAAKGVENIDQPQPGSPLLGDLPPEVPLPDESTPEGRELYESIIQEAANLHGVDEDLVRAVIQTESGFDPQAVSRVGAKGLMQMMPATAKRMGVEDPFDPRENIMGGVKYLRMLLDMFQGDVSLAVAGYNAGEHAVVRHNGVPPYRETQGYVRKILGLLAGGSPRVAPVAASTAAPAVQPVKPPAKPSVIYKWRDSQGRVFLSDTPPPDRTPYVILSKQAE